VLALGPHLRPQAELDQTSLPFSPILGHVGQGNFHTALPYRNRAEHAEARAVAGRMTELAQSLGGTCTGEQYVHEHGVVQLTLQRHRRRQAPIPRTRARRLARPSPRHQAPHRPSEHHEPWSSHSAEDRAIDDATSMTHDAVIETRRACRSPPSCACRAWPESRRRWRPQPRARGLCWARRPCRR